MSPMYDYKFLLCSNAAFTAAEYSYTAGNEVNFGVTTPNVGRSGKFGLHIIVTTVFATLTSGVIIWIVHGAATTPTTKHVGRFLSAANLAAAKHYFVPGGHSLLQYAAAYFAPVSEAATGGKLTMYFGPDEDGAE